MVFCDDENSWRMIEVTSRIDSHDGAQSRHVDTRYPVVYVPISEAWWVVRLENLQVRLVDHIVRQNVVVHVEMLLLAARGGLALRCPWSDNTTVCLLLELSYCKHKRNSRQLILPAHAL